MTFPNILIGSKAIFVSAVVLILIGQPPAKAQTLEAAPGSRISGPYDARPLQRVRRAPTRLRVYRQFPGPNSQRVCNARYVQEYRPSGTVIVPVVNCYWSG